MRKIPFSPPDIGEEEINEVVNTLKSGWITTGPKTKEFEKNIAEFCETEKAVCLNSATACLESTLRLLGIGQGDEVITCSYTYTASASVINHVGAKIILVDTQKDEFAMDFEKLESAITNKTKAIISVDLGGKMCDYDKIFEIVERKKELFESNNELQKAFSKIIVIADAAHSIGASYKGQRSGSVADFSCFSFHAVKNLTTAEGGAVVWKDIQGIDNEDIYKQFMLLSLHGQSKDALAKTKLGSWEYDIATLGYKCNMTDIMASIGLAQLKRYNKLLARRREIIGMYNKAFKDKNLYKPYIHFNDIYQSSGHLYLLRIIGIDETKRNDIITKMAERGISTNVHYKPLPMHTGYKELGFDIKDFPNCYNQYKNEITLPLHTKLTNEDVEYIANNLIEVVNGL